GYRLPGRRKTGVDQERDEQQESDAGDHGEGQEPLPDDAPHQALARIRDDLPDAIERGLELREHRGGTGREKNEADHHRAGPSLWAVRAPEDGLDHVGAVVAYEGAHLGHDSPFHGRALEDEADNG